ncbi:hypothetical protein T440DRAFT_399056 [Plenodomus tracheiphilus IPT5]|uniref:Mid2 domain-containing protein n=1 Tax=Plenodomus tracheiphilus IPT5 TaxID=1408161 RepID=A0A6A7B5F8_9PLEO|nr:hypothetical protein T440DRAFT_399056 [Plenodomus tracheiphilus IPT5]
MSIYSILTPVWLPLVIACCVLASPFSPSLEVRTAPGETVRDTYDALRRGLAAASLQRRKGFTDEINLARSWNDATLLHIEVEQGVPQNNENRSLTINAGIDITCTTCYVRGLATASLTIDDNFDVSQAINATADSVTDNVNDLATSITDYLNGYAKSVMTNLADGVAWSDFDLPTFPYRFDLEVPPMPECHLRFQFDDMELYMAVDTVLSAGATYEINLFASQSVAGIKVGPMLQLGFVLQVDLILAIEGEVDISSGIHIMFDDGVALELDLFSDKVSNMIMNGGQFEFLPVTVNSAGVVISAALRVGVHCGIEVGTPKPGLLNSFEVQSGIEVAAWANVAEFVTNITYTPDDEDCELKVVQEFNIAVGAIAGASLVVDFIGIDPQTWGPVAEASTAIYTTTLAEACAIKGTPAALPASITAAAEKRDDLTTTTLTTEVTTTGVSCKATGLANCPISEQVSTKAVVTKYFTTAVPSGVEAVFPNATHTTVGSTIPFGSLAKTIRKTSGSPTAYVAPTDTDTDTIDKVLGGEVGGTSKKLIVGICVGLGIPILLGALGAYLFFQRRKKYAQVSPAAAPMVAEPYAHDLGYADEINGSKQVGAAVSEVQH